jgi:phage gp16-like protein
MNRRNLDLSKIHIAKKDLAMDDDTYRAMLNRVAGVTSAKDLSPTKTAAVIAEFKRLGWEPKSGKSGRSAPKVVPDRQKQIGKIGAFLAEAGREWGYVDGMAQKMFKVERVEWLNAKQLSGLISALTYDAKRNGRLTR